MAKELSGPHIAPGDIAEVYQVAAVPVGTRMFDDQGNEYIFLLGVASTAVASWVTYDESGVTALLATGAVGPVAIAMSASVADVWGWYQIYGYAIGKGASCAEVALEDNTTDMGRTSADGTVGGGPTAGDIIYGVVARSAMEAASGNTTTKFQLSYPWLDAQTAAH